MPDLSSDPIPRLRAADADRDATVERLRAAYGEGRLREQELEERLGAALAACTVAELAVLTRDLPPASRPRPTRPPARRLRQAAWGTWVLAVSINVVIWLLVSLSSREVVYFWPAWVAGPWGAVLLSSTFFGRGWCATAHPSR
ncbi:MAG: DUF1707 domain-containing protein [Actinomycetota bacterium]|nr:DUF1707 domain-containing protein [Actinomycetota bacterium]